MACPTTILSDSVYSKKLAQLRDRSLVPREVRSITAELSSILAGTAIEPASPTEQVAVFVVLRSGMAMSDAFLNQFPADVNTVVYHLGLFRDRKTLQPVEYYNKLGPKSPKVKHGYILDPLMATGGTAEAAISIVK